MDTRNIKLCVIGEFPPPPGGMAIQAHDLVENLKKEKVTISVIKRNIELYKSFAWLDKIKIVRSLIRFLLFNLKLAVTIFRVDSLYIFSNSYLSFYLYTVLPIMLGKIFNKKVIISYHGGAAKEFFGKRYNFIARATLKLADRIVVPSVYLKVIFQGMGYSRICVVPNTIDVSRFTYKIRETLSPKFIVSRHLEPEYNIEMLIKAFKIVVSDYSDARLQVCGDGSERKKLEEQVRNLDLENHVEFLGNIENDNMPGKYNDADIFLNASNIDNFPRAITEAFACGLPVITTKAGGIAYLVEDGKTGLLVDLNDYQSMAREIKKLLENPKLGKFLAVNACKSLEKYQWGNIRNLLVPILTLEQKPNVFANIYQNIIFRMIDIARGRNNISKLKFLRKSQYWEKDVLQKWQINRLNELLISAKKDSPFYKEKFKDIILPLRNLEELQNIPILTKKDIRDKKESIKFQNIPENIFIEGKTGGSTGEPMHYYYDRRGRGWNRGSVYRSQEWAGTYLGEKVIQMTGSHYDYTEFNKIKWKFTFWLHRYKNLPVSVVNNAIFEKYYKELIQYKPTSIWGYSSGIYYFAKYIDEKHKNTDVGFLKAIITSSETLYDFQRKKINEVFGKDKVYDHYGSREFYIASECREHKGYHIHAETLLIEVVDNNGRHKKPGELGRILVTDLSNLAFPFIRYEIGDVGIMSNDEDCPCGVTLPKLARVEGRVADVIILPDRILTPPNFTILLSDYEGIEAYQIRQKTKTDLKVNIVKNNSFRKEYEEYIKSGLLDMVGAGVNTEIAYVDHIEIPASGKRRYVISEVSQDSL